MGVSMRHFSLLIAILYTFNSYALTKNTTKLVYFETRANAVAERSNQPVPIFHYDIPAALVKSLSSEYADADAYKSLVYKNEQGQEMVRWVINPEDTKWHLEVAKFLQSKGLDATPKQYFTGYQSASRSYVVEDPKTGHEFFLKVSTNNTGGNWKDKKQEWHDCLDVKAAADHVQHAIALHQPQYFKYMDESLVFGIEALDQGMVIRSLTQLSNSEFYYLPGFSAVHEKTGAEIARLNGSNDPAEFWNEHYNKPLGRALAEFAVMTGLTYDSPHSQNFLVELDKNMRPTGKIVLRDTGDVFVAKNYLAGWDHGLAKNWTPANVTTDIRTGVGVLHGNKHPSWIDEKTYKQWGRDFYAEHDAVISQLTGISAAELGKTMTPVYQNGRYFGRSILPQGQAWDHFVSTLKANDGFVQSAKLLCSQIFK